MKLEKKINWAILVTGWGRNATDTIQAYVNGKLKRSTIKLVVYQEEPCGAKEIAEQHGIETLKLVRADFNDLLSYQKALTKVIKDRDIDFIFMLNYKYIIKDDMLRSFPNKIINIHPSLFPSFLATKTAIQDAIDYGVKVTGITTHVIDDKIDEGLILCQKAIKVKDNDTFETLYPKFAKHGKKIVLKTIQKIENSFFGK